MAMRIFPALWLALSVFISHDDVFADASAEGTAFGEAADADETPSSSSALEENLPEGTVTKMATCLAIANDRYAFELWESDVLKQARMLPVDELAAFLSVLYPSVRHEFGFGTIYLCSQIVGSWYVLQSDTDGQSAETYSRALEDGRLGHGVVVIDLAVQSKRSFDLARGYRPGAVSKSNVKSSHYGLIDALPLVRLLSTPSLLPRSFYGGIVIRHARIEGALLFNNVQLAMPLAFVDVQFRGQDYSKGVFGQAMPIEDTAIVIDSSEFDGSLLIVRSHVCGHVRIIDSRFNKSVTLQDVEQQMLDCRSLTELERISVAPPFMRVDASEFAQNLKFVRSTFGRLDVVGGTISNLSAARSDFGKIAKIVENEIDSIQFNCSVLAEETSISFNQIKKDLFIDGDATRYFGPGDIGRSCHDWWHDGSRLALGRKSRIEIASNKIGGGLGMRHFAPQTLHASVRLSSNRIGSGSEIKLPGPHTDGRPWHGVFDLQGSIYEGTMFIGIDAHEKSLQHRVYGYEAQTSYCSTTNQHFQGSVIKLRAAQVQTLIWDLPLTCDLRWLGNGLTYDLWLPGSMSKAGLPTDLSNEERDRLAFRSWRHTLARIQPTALSTMSRYLTENGAAQHGKALLVEVKRFEYLPDCSPDGSTHSCAIDAFANGNPLSAATSMLMWISGFGVMPERIIIVAMVSIFFFSGLYKIYIWYERYNLRNSLARLDAIARDLEVKCDNADDVAAEIGSIRSELLGDDPDARGLCEEIRPLSIRLANAARKLDVDAAGIEEIARKQHFVGSSGIVGFSRFDGSHSDDKFYALHYSLDAMIPVIDLHAYSRYYPMRGPVRVLSVAQHILGWIFLTLFTYSVAAIGG